MTSNSSAEPLSAHDVPVTEFELNEGGMLEMANFVEATTRADFYEVVADSWGASPQDLADAMDDCEPLAWAVHGIYSRFREEIAEDIQSAQANGKRFNDRLNALQARLDALPEEPYDGAINWLLGLTSGEFEIRIVPAIENWFGDSPDWSFEDDYLLESRPRGLLRALPWSSFARCRQTISIRSESLPWKATGPAAPITQLS